MKKATGKLSGLDLLDLFDQVAADLGLGSAPWSYEEAEKITTIIGKGIKGFIMPEKLHRCVKKVKARGGARNAWAICNASLKKGKTKKKGKAKK